MLFTPEKLVNKIILNNLFFKYIAKISDFRRKYVVKHNNPACFSYVLRLLPRKSIVINTYL